MGTIMTFTRLSEDEKHELFMRRIEAGRKSKRTIGCRMNIG